MFSRNFVLYIFKGELHRVQCSNNKIPNILHPPVEFASNLSLSLSLSLTHSYFMYLQSCAYRRGDDPALTDDGSSTGEVPLPIHSHLKQGYFCTDVDIGGQNNSSQGVQRLISSIYAIVYTRLYNLTRPATSHILPLSTQSLFSYE